MKKVEIGDLRSKITSVFYTKTYQLFDYIREVQKQIGPCNLRICTFSNSEEFLRRMLVFKTRGRFMEMEIVSDRRGLTKTMKLASLMRNVYSRSYVAANHGKMVLMYNDDFKVSILTSQNQTRGSRYEVHTITNDPVIYASLSESWDNIICHATNIDNILARKSQRDREAGIVVDSDT